MELERWEALEGKGGGGLLPPAQKEESFSDVSLILESYHFKNIVFVLDLWTVNFEHFGGIRNCTSSARIKRSIKQTPPNVIRSYGTLGQVNG